MRSATFAKGKTQTHKHHISLLPSILFKSLLSISIFVSSSFSLSFNIHLIKLWKKKFSSQVSRAWEIIFVIVRTIPLKIIVMLQEATHHKRQPSQTAPTSLLKMKIFVYMKNTTKIKKILCETENVNVLIVLHTFFTLWCFLAIAFWCCCRYRSRHQFKLL